MSKKIKNRKKKKTSLIKVGSFIKGKGLDYNEYCYTNQYSICKVLYVKKPGSTNQDIFNECKRQGMVNPSRLILNSCNILVQILDQSQHEFTINEKYWVDSNRFIKTKYEQKTTKKEESITF